MALALADRLLADGLILGRRGVGYARISDDAIEQLSSLNNQIEYFGEFFEEAGLKMVTECGMYHKRNGTKHLLSGIYADEGISGTSLRRREAFKKMIADALAGFFDVIVVKSIARWARDVENGYPIIKDLAEKGVAVYFLDNNLSTLDPDADDRIVRGLADAQTESRSKSRNVQFGIRRSQKKGKWTVMPAYGYDKVDGMLQPNIFELCVVMDIAYLFYKESYGGKRIKNYLEDAGVKTKTGLEKWSIEAILNIISNPIFAGLQVQHTVQTKDVNRDVRVKIDPSKWVITYRPELAIFTFDHWNLLQIERQSRKGRAEYQQIYVDENGEPKIKVIEGNPDAVKIRHSSKYTLSNLVYCGNCGRAHRRRSRRTKNVEFRWTCSTYQNIGLKGCKYHNTVYEHDLMELIKNEIVKFRNDRQSREWFLEAFLKVNFREADQARLTELDEQYNTIANRLNDTLDQLSDGKLPKDFLNKRLEGLRRDLEAVQTEQRVIRNRDEGIATVRLKFDEFMEFLESVDVDDLQNGVLRRIIDRITISTDEVKKKRGEDAMSIDIAWKFLDKSEDDIAWQYFGVEAEEWKRNVWYGGMTDEEVAEEENRIAMQNEWEQTPEGQQYLREQDELRQEIFEHEHLNTKATR